MGALANIYLKEETLDVLLKTVRAKKEKGVSLTISINDETNEWGQNLTAFVSQTKEQREGKVKKFYVGNGAVTWIKDGVKVAEKVNKGEEGKQANKEEEEDSLPF